MTDSRQASHAEVLAMEAYALDPGHSDLDDEQPMSIPLPPRRETNSRGDEFYSPQSLRCTLGDVRRVQRAKTMRDNLQRAERRLRQYQRAVRGPNWSHTTGLAGAYADEMTSETYAGAAQLFAFDLSCVLNALGQR